MSFFDKIFGKPEEEAVRNFWKNMGSEDELEAAVRESFQKKVGIFKHSTRCFISKTVLRNFEKEVGNSENSYSFYFLDLLAHRDLSDKIAEEFKVTHQSPQLIVLENGKAVNDASHQNISLKIM